MKEKGDENLKTITHRQEYMKKKGDEQESETHEHSQEKDHENK